MIGAGIAGLTAAVALRRRGWEVVVFEATDDIVGLGAGITLWPNAVAALDALGIGERLRAVGRAQSAGVVINERGQTLFRQVSRDGQFMYGMHRADLIDVLRDAAGEVRTGMAVTDVATDGTVVVNGKEQRFDLVVAADGVHSVVREKLWPEAGGETDTGVLAFRWISSIPVERSSVVWGRSGECGIVALSDRSTYVFTASRGSAREAGLDYFVDWPDPLPRLISELDAEPLRHDLTELAVPRTLVKGKVVLIGDAAHAMRPHLGQGAGLAVEDGLALAQMWPDLAAFDRRRRRRALATSTMARLATTLMMPGSRPLVVARDLALRATPDRLIMAPADYLARWRPSDTACHD